MTVDKRLMMAATPVHGPNFHTIPSIRSGSAGDAISYVQRTTYAAVTAPSERLTRPSCSGMTGILDRAAADRQAPRPAAQDSTEPCLWLCARIRMSESRSSRQGRSRSHEGQHLVKVAGENVFLA